ncbi:ATP-binding protein [uncultured Caulobacter sp.]|uniref:ATP-binding protein n=1 Tax=uncultured Caulobacter sp. TaxID=158749 RepID=UPI00262D181D|nr:ATP-binding protein [uncultured Caulobacter sp.]
MATVAWRNTSRDWSRPAALICAYLAAVLYSLFLAGATHGIPSIWTANAVAIGALLALSPRQWPGFLGVCGLAHLGLELVVGDGWRFGVLVTLLDTAQIVGTAVLMRILGAPSRVRGPRGLILVISVGSALTAAGSILANGVLSISAGRPFLLGWTDWMSSNVLGVAIALPITLILADRRHRDGFKVHPTESLATVALGAATSVLVFSGEVAYPALLFAPALLATFRGGPRAVAAVVTASLAAAIPAVLHRTGLAPHANLQPLRQALVFHIALYVVSLMTALALARQARLQVLLERRQAAARAAQARAQAANAAKSEFLATISHEIRTPLNSILGFAALVADDPSLSTENRRRLDLIGRAGRSLTEIVGDLLDFAKVEAGRLELSLAPTAPAALLRDAVAIVAPAASAKGLDLRAEVRSVGEEDAEAVFALDETRLRQVLLNLLANALKFTSEGGVLARLTAGPGRGQLSFEVIDTGIGIAPEVQPRLFQRFSQADSSISRSYGGTGLGLAISKALISAMGGEIGVESRPGEGARFWITLTAERRDPVAAARPAEPADVAADRAVRVLLVDDHPMNRELGTALLTLAGCAVTTAENGLQALEAARGGAFDLVLMDVHMPGMDGLAATRAIRALPGPAAEMPIIALSADVLPEQIARCRAAGMTDHVGKPIRREDLFAAVARALEQAAARDDVEAGNTPTEAFISVPPG